ncbi:hypothetical protein Pcinc_008156 [Petrolisthes cinctipes]|uniref:Peroxidase n=2 Tax=Petrolisthes cinctipes TaxID=88211 RepID=A0AAE1KXT6_PETCI|nr:hypothetical protein Pcinc_008156 [Petrolisthes cinctipes]
MKKTEVEEELVKRNVSLRRGSASYRHQEGFRKTDPLATNMSRLGYTMDRASSSMSRRMNITRETSSFDSRWIGDLSSSPYCDQERLRPRPSPCNPTHPYRSVDGTCNNIDNPNWGASFTPFRRAMPPEYGDGLSSLRRAKDGEDLPSARQVSNRVHINRMADSQSYSVLTMSWGQFVDHDITLTAQTKGSGGKSIACCPDLVRGDPRLFHPECAPISIPPDDPFYGPFNQTCMEFVRSAPAPKCQFGPRDQINQQTAFLDGSAVYGYSPHQLASLRTMSDGLLRSQVTLDGRELLPPSTNPEDGCNKEEEYKYDRFCFLAGQSVRQVGDPRANEQLLLTIFHTIWARQHNLLALSLKELNPEWDDERLFQEARRIVIAQMQHITYHEYVPSIIGPKLMKHLKLSPQSGGKFTEDYDSKLHPGIANEFAAAAYRFGHSQIQGLVQKIDAPEKNVDFNQLASITFNPFSLYDPGIMDKYVRGEASQRTAAVDTYFSSQVTGKLFRGEEKFGIDLVAINLQRGRDHGVGGYLRARMYCGLPPHTNFTHLTADVDAGALASIQQVYSNVEDIDLYTGGLAERPVESGLVGPTFACILADQFLRLKRGDRFWYETDLKPQAFTKDQLVELHKTSLARIICDNVAEMGSIQRWPLRTYATGNPRLPCTSGSIPRVDLGAWEEGDI